MTNGVDGSISICASAYLVSNTTVYLVTRYPPPTTSRPSRRIFRYRPRRVRPRTRAVSEMLPRVRSSVAAISSRSICSTAAARFPGSSARRVSADVVPAPAARRWRREIGRQVFGFDRAARRAHGDRALNLVPQLPHVARPPIPREQVERRRAQVDVRLAEPLARVAQEERAQVRDLLAPFAQRRHVDADHAEAVVEILAELALRPPAVRGRRWSRRARARRPPAAASRRPA